MKRQNFCAVLSNLGDTRSVLKQMLMRTHTGEPFKKYYRYFLYAFNLPTLAFPVKCIRPQFHWIFFAAQIFFYCTIVAVATVIFRFTQSLGILWCCLSTGSLWSRQNKHTVQNCWFPSCNALVCSPQIKQKTFGSFKQRLLGDASIYCARFSEKNYSNKTYRILDKIEFHKCNATLNFTANLLEFNSDSIELTSDTATLSTGQQASKSKQANNLKFLFTLKKWHMWTMAHVARLSWVKKAISTVENRKHQKSQIQR